MSYADELDQLIPHPVSHIYKPAGLRIADLNLHDIHIQNNDLGRTQVYVMGNYSTQHDVILWEDDGVKMNSRWCRIAEAVCGWLNLPFEEREIRRKKHI